MVRFKINQLKIFIMIWGLS